MGWGLVLNKNRTFVLKMNESSFFKGCSFSAQKLSILSPKIPTSMSYETIPFCRPLTVVLGGNQISYFEFFLLLVLILSSHNFPFPFWCNFEAVMMQAWGRLHRAVFDYFCGHTLDCIG